MSTKSRLSAKGLVLTKHAPGVFGQTELATFAAGCFWGVEEEFRKRKGVLATAVGYTGGRTEAPSYEQVCAGDTGHAEAVQIEFDPQAISYDELLQLFWGLHDPTTLNRQGPDVGDQYRSVIFFHAPGQKASALMTRDRLQQSGELGGREIVTEIVPAATFYKAEEYHQQYVEKGGLAACHIRRPVL